MLSPIASRFHAPIRTLGHVNPFPAIKRTQDVTPRAELPSTSSVNTNPMPHAHREAVIDTAGASFWAVQALRQEEEKRNPRF